MIDIYDPMTFLTVIFIAFAIVMILAGLFTAFFGSGRGRTIGLLILLVGVIVGGVWIWLTGLSDIEPFCNVELANVFAESLVNLIAVAIGAIVAVVIFLVGVMKS